MNRRLISYLAIEREGKPACIKRNRRGDDELPLNSFPIYARSKHEAWAKYEVLIREREKQSQKKQSLVLPAIQKFVKLSSVQDSTTVETVQEQPKQEDLIVGGMKIGAVWT